MNEHSRSSMVIKQWPSPSSTGVAQDEGVLKNKVIY